MRYLLVIALVLAACGGSEPKPFLRDEVRVFAIYDERSPGEYAILYMGHISLAADGGTMSGTWDCAESRDASGALTGRQEGPLSGTLDGDRLALTLKGGQADIKVSATVVTTGSLHRLDGNAEIGAASHLFAAWDGVDVLR